MLRYLLDTNIVIYVLKRRPIEVLPVFNANAGRMAISAITMAELLHGAEKSGRVSENLSVVEDFCSRLDVLPYGVKAAQHYGAIRAVLEKLGRPIGVIEPARLRRFMSRLNTAGEGCGEAGAPTSVIVPSRLSSAKIASRSCGAATVFGMKSRRLADAAISSALRDTMTSCAWTGRRSSTILS
ncbi:hypothetical protein CDEN61S_01806 [Castellaniella denitrificans]